MYAYMCSSTREHIYIYIYIYISIHIYIYTLIHKFVYTYTNIFTILPDEEDNGNTGKVRSKFKSQSNRPKDSWKSSSAQSMLIMKTKEICMDEYMHVWEYACMSICMNICVYEYICVWVYVCVSICMHNCVYV